VKFDKLLLSKYWRQSRIYCFDQ